MFPMTLPQTLTALPTGACPPWCDGHAGDFQPWWHHDAGQRERDHATYFESVGERGDLVTVGLVAVQTPAGIGPGRVVLDPEGTGAVEQRLTPGQAEAIATALASDGHTPEVVSQMRAAAAMARGWLN
jgi:hypothetical protein